VGTLEQGEFKWGPPLPGSREMGIQEQMGIQEPGPSNQVPSFTPPPPGPLFASKITK